MRKGLLLDRDGIINVDYGHVHRREDFVFNSGIFELVAAAKRANYVVVVVTNQGGIGRGYFTESDFWVLMDWVAAEFEQRQGRLDKIYFCPVHPEHGVGDYRCDSFFRKPQPGMLLQAAEEFGLDLSLSILIGDALSDMEAGVRAGVGRLFYLGTERVSPPVMPLTNLIEAIGYLS